MWPLGPINPWDAGTRLVSCLMEKSIISKNKSVFAGILSISNQLRCKCCYTPIGNGVWRLLKDSWDVCLCDLIRALQKLFLFDHVGIKPLYYSYEQGHFLSSELKGLTTFFHEQSIPLERHPEALELYSVFGYIPSPLTLSLHLEAPKILVLTFDLRTKEPPVVQSYILKDSIRENEKAFAALIEERTLEHLVADVPVGIFSRGTDSSLIASILHKHAITLKAFSIRMDGKVRMNTVLMPFM